MRPDLIIEIRGDVLVEVDGPMLRHGIQEMAGRHLTVPTHRASHPERANLDQRYEEFRSAH